MSIPAGYTQIPSTGLLVRNNDGSGPYYLTAGGVPTAMPVSSGGGSTDIWTEGGVAIDTEGGVAIATEG